MLRPGIARGCPAATMTATAPSAAAAPRAAPIPARSAQRPADPASTDPPARRGEPGRDAGQPGPSWSRRVAQRRSRADRTSTVLAATASATSATRATFCMTATSSRSPESYAEGTVGDPSPALAIPSTPARRRTPTRGVGVLAWGRPSPLRRPRPAPGRSRCSGDDGAPGLPR